jgi:prepilin-type N-terminal cleavage/methylation domain-containing protein
VKKTPAHPGALGGRGARACAGDLFPLGFSLIEILVSISIIAVLLSVLLPSLSGAREAGRATACLSNLRELGTAWALYANDYADRAMPLAYWSSQDIGTGEEVFWWGTHGTTTLPVDHARGFIAPYLDAELAKGSVFECPAQPWGSYRPQGPSGGITSTYGYNGYYLSPSKTPGWGSSIASRPWRRIFEIREPTSLFVFADAMLAGAPLRNSALLDPPQIWDGSSTWYPNDYPTTCFRHASKGGSAGAAAAVGADTSARTYRADPGCLTTPEQAIGAVGSGNAPHYVPDAAEWR